MGGGWMSVRQRAIRLMPVAIAFGAVCAAGWAIAVSVSPLVPVSPGNPFSGCTADHVAQQLGTNYRGSQVEPWLAVNPANRNNLVGTWQQDRWSNGGSRGL